MKPIAIFLLSGLLAWSPAWSEELSLQVGQHVVHAEIAATPASRSLGLMNRKELCADCGMLFVFEQAGNYAFWMKNTLLPLSIAFIAADGSIINIDEMQANTTDIHQARGMALYALEMNGNWFADNGINAHDKVRGFEQLSESGH
jgi:uncharacterized protein